MRAKGFSKQSKRILVAMATGAIVFVSLLVCLMFRDAEEVVEAAPVTTPEAVQIPVVEPEEVVEEEPAPMPTPTPEPTPEPVTYVERTFYDVPLDLEFQFFVIDLCEEHHIDPVIVFSMMDTESNYTADIIGDNGNSFGLMQIQPRWHSARMERLGVTDLLNPYQNVMVGVDLLSELSEYGRDISWMLMAYNGGVAHANEFLVEGRISYYAYEILKQAEVLKEGEQVGYFRTDDPLLDFGRWDAHQAEQLERLPVCADCEEPIQDERAYYINGEWICMNCMSAYEREVEPE